MAEHAVEDPDDPRLADYVGLRDPAFRERIEAQRGFFVAESPHVVRRVLASGRRVRSVLVTPQQRDLLEELAHVDAPVYVATAEVLRSVVGFDLHRGALAAVDRWPLPSVGAVLRDAQRVAVLERINDHENLGVLFRSAAALGIDAVVIDAQCADPLYRRAVRVSIGHTVTLPWTRCESLAELHGVGFSLVALTPAPSAVAIDAFEWPQRCALLFGAEGPGLSEQWLRDADAHVRIPMRDDIDSLNVATAAAIAFWASRTG